MSLLIYIIFLGLVQGFTEFLPISSSGHLAILENIPYFSECTNLLENKISLLAFNIVLHMGTLLAVIVYWFKDLVAIARQFFNDIKLRNFKGEGVKTITVIFFALLPVLIIPFVKDRVESFVHNIKIVSIFFIANGFILIASNIWYKKKSNQQSKKISEMNWKNGLFIGVFQAIAVLPGISRSGSTISAGLLQNIGGVSSVKFSFLISIPVLAAAALLEGWEVRNSLQFSKDSIPLLFAGAFAAFIAGIISSRLLEWIGKTVNFLPFGIYTILLGLVFLGINL